MHLILSIVIALMIFASIQAGTFGFFRASLSSWLGWLRPSRCW